MNYTAEQREIIQRIDDISVRFNEILRRQQEAQLAEDERLIDAITALRTAIDRSRELMPLFQQHGDAFREFLNTL
jgi:hypothetical protein